MKLQVLKDHTGIYRAYFVLYTASNGVTYHLIVNKFMGYTLGADSEGFFEADLPAEERKYFWDKSISEINAAFPEEAKFSNNSFDPDLVYPEGYAKD